MSYEFHSLFTFYFHYCYMNCLTVSKYLNDYHLTLFTVLYRYFPPLFYCLKFLSFNKTYLHFSLLWHSVLLWYGLGSFLLHKKDTNWQLGRRFKFGQGVSTSIVLLRHFSCPVITDSAHRSIWHLNHFTVSDPSNNGLDFISISSIFTTKSVHN